MTLAVIRSATVGRKKPVTFCNYLLHKNTATNQFLCLDAEVSTFGLAKKNHLSIRANLIATLTRAAAREYFNI
jgi:hypothetical protein